MSAWREVAPAKLTWRLAVGERRPDGYHELEAEMVSLDLADELLITEPGEGIELIAEPWARADGLLLGDENLISRALELCGRQASVTLTKRVPLGGGLGGGSSDAAAVLRWAGLTDLQAAATLGGDVPFCLAGGRALVRGIGEQVEPLEHLARTVVLVLPPFGIDTGAAYRALDELRLHGRGHDERNDLTAAAASLSPQLGRFKAALGALTGATPVLAGSGSTLFVEGTKVSLGLAGMDELVVDGLTARVLEASTIPADTGGAMVP
jgi:4-diphosphocytidyl-2-C-methyl-D-erythritol kinase